MITSPVWGDGRYVRVRYIGGLITFLLAAMASAAVVGGLCGLLGSGLVAVRPILWAVTAGVATSYAAAEVRGMAWWVPQRHWQVPRSWGVYGRFRFALAFGLALGPGFFTFVPFIGYYLLLADCIAGGNPLQGAGLMAIFGATRATPVVMAPLLAWARGGTCSVDVGVAANHWIERRESGLRCLRAAALVASAASAGIWFLASP